MAFPMHGRCASTLKGFPSPCRNLQAAQLKLTGLQREKEAAEAERAASAKLTAPKDPAAAPNDASAESSSSSESGPPSDPPKAAAGASSSQGRDAYVSGRPFLSLGDLQKFAGVAGEPFGPLFSPWPPPCPLRLCKGCSKLPLRQYWCSGSHAVYLCLAVIVDRCAYVCV